MIFKLKIDHDTDFKKLKLTFQIMDKDVISANDYLSGHIINDAAIKELIDGCMLTGRSAKYFPDEDSRKASNGKFTVETLKNPNRPDSVQSKLVLSIEMVTEEEAKIRPVGVGRGNPNQDPYLPEPTGRFQFSWNPFKLLVGLNLNIRSR